MTLPTHTLEDYGEENLRLQNRAGQGGNLAGLPIPSLFHVKKGEQEGGMGEHVSREKDPGLLIGSSRLTTSR